MIKFNYIKHTYGDVQGHVDKNNHILDGLKDQLIENHNLLIHGGINIKKHVVENLLNKVNLKIKNKKQKSKQSPKMRQ
jgi:hypothetical protein